jgi:hypothetical protein
MIKQINETVFDRILSPVLPLLELEQKGLNKDSEKYKLHLIPFSVNILFAIISQIKSISLLITETKSHRDAEKMGLVVASKSMYNEAFSRYKPELFRRIFFQLLANLNLKEINELKSLGRFFLVDGSIFPAISNMAWANYKKSTNAIKMHLSFELNRMIPVEFISTEANYSEKAFLEDILKEGMTYICDRGYISFKIFKSICDKGAFFVIRGKSNMQFVVKELKDVSVPDEFIKHLDSIKDSMVVFKSDDSDIVYRIVEFTALGETYSLITNRYDLTTYEVIMLYAYRWQVELCFRFIKRTLKGIHLMNQSPRGIETQFYLYMIAYLLLMTFKQETVTNCDNNDKDKKDEGIDASSETSKKFVCSDKEKSGRPYARGLVSILGEKLQRYWKIGIHWLVALKNQLVAIYDENSVKTIAANS